MKRLIISIFFLSLAAFIAINAKVVRNYSSHSDGKLTFTVDSIDYRQNLTRIYGHLLGKPHTSNRIDGVIITGTSVSYTSSDIDGIDFRRYFQWEDDGSIPVELDFPVMKRLESARLIFETPHGQSTTTVVKVKQATKRK